MEQASSKSTGQQNTVYCLALRLMTKVLESCLERHFKKADFHLVPATFPRQEASFLGMFFSPAENVSLAVMP